MMVSNFTRRWNPIPTQQETLILSTLSSRDQDTAILAEGVSDEISEERYHYNS